VVPLIFGFIILKYSDVLDSKTFKNKFGPLIEGVETKNIAASLWNVIGLIRLQLTISIIILLKDYSTFQLLFLTMLSILSQIYMILSKPFGSLSELYLNTFNECFVTLYLLSYFLLTEFTQDFPEIQSYAGTSQLVLMSLSILMNFVYITWNIIKVTRDNFLKWYYKRKTKKEAIV
jgi:hypothetical protein